MIIGVNTRFLLGSKMEGFGWYTYEVCKRIVESHPEHQFVFFFDRPYLEKFVFAENVTPVVVSPPARHPILFMYWFEIGLKKALKKHKVDLFFSPDGYLSLSSAVPQVSVLHDLSFKHRPKDLPLLARRYLNYFFPRFVHKAKHIITVSQSSKNDIISTYEIPESKVTVAWNGASEAYRVLSIQERESTIRSITGGAPYFVFVGAITPRKNISRLLDAFHLFKSTTDFPHHLVIVGEAQWKNASVADHVHDTSKQYIHFTGHLPLEKLTQVMGSAYALVYVPFFEGFGIPLVEAMKCGIPIISGDRTSLPEVVGNAAIYCNPFETEQIVERMKELAGDANLHQQLSENSLQRSQSFSWDTTAKTVWNVLTEVAAKNKEQS